MDNDSFGSQCRDRDTYSSMPAYMYFSLDGNSNWENLGKKVMSEEKRYMVWL